MTSTSFPAAGVSRRPTGSSSTRGSTGWVTRATTTSSTSRNGLHAHPKPTAAAVGLGVSPATTTHLHSSPPASKFHAMAADPWFQSLFADRIGGANYGKGTEIYKFEKIKRAKRKALADYPNRQLLDFGIGENDDMAPEQVRAEMKRQVDRIDNRGYA